MAIVRPCNPNLAELSMYVGLQDHFDLTFFYTGPSEHQCRSQLAAMGLRHVRIERYRGHNDIMPQGPLRSVIDYRLGFASYMGSKLRDVLEHEIINIVDPIYGFVDQIVSRIAPSRRLVLWRWEILADRYEKPWRGTARARRAMERADVIVCATQAARGTLGAAAALAGARLSASVSTIYPGVSVSSRLSDSSNETRARIACVARLHWQKGIGDLLAAMQILRADKGIDASLDLIGSGGDQWRRQVRQLGLDDAVSFHGTLSNADVRRVIAKSAVYCQPSATSATWCEQYGFAVVEAMLAGKPVVATDSGALREVVGPDGEFTSARNPHSLAAGLARLLNDRDGRRQRGERLARFASERYDSARAGERFMEAAENA